MNDLKGLARVVLIGVVAYITIPTFMSLLFMIPSLISFDLGLFTSLQNLLPLIAQILLTTVAVYLLTFRLDRLVSFLVKEDAEIKPENWSPARVYRLATVIMGGFFFYYSVVGIASSLGKLIDYGIIYKIYSGGAEWGESATQILSLIILLALSIYLLMGAPHFVKWQVKKSLEQCGEKSEEKIPVSSQP